MLRYFKESLNWLHLTFFKPVTLEEKTGNITNKEANRIFYLKVLPVGILCVVIILSLIGSVCVILGCPFSWRIAFVQVGLRSLGLFLLGLGLKSAYKKGLFVGFILWVILGTSVSMGILSKTNFIYVLGVMVGFTAVATRHPIFAIVIGVICQIIFGIGVWMESGLTRAMFEATGFGSAYFFTFYLLYFRPFYVIPHLIAYLVSRKSKDPFRSFLRSPIYWDETIAAPLPYLSNWLVELASNNRNRALTEISYIAAKNIHQEAAAQKALLMIAIQNLQDIDSVKKMENASRILKFLPSDTERLPKGLSDVQRRIDAISSLAGDYNRRKTLVGQAKVLKELRSEVEAFRAALVLVKRPVGPAFQPLASRWLNIVEKSEAEGHKRMDFKPIDNPFVAGTPLQQRDHDLFKGRKDIIVAIEENIINPSQRPALLLYGRRRIGKTSTLLNLPHLLSSQFTPVFIDCQNAKWRDGDAAFCYHLAREVSKKLDQRNSLDGLGKPALKQFEKYAFTRLDEFLDQVEALSRRINKQILLTFDEYERLEEGIAAQKITREVFNQLRNIVQHRERIVVLFSGGHRFEELRIVNWSDYLINVKTLELSFLAPEDARELLTEPVPALHYEPGVVDAIIALTHCQPYLLQAVASDLVNYLNAQKRQTATMADLDVAVAKVLVTADAYFHNNWAECSDDEREALRALATDEAVSTQIEQRQTAWQSLSRKEIVEMRDDRYRFAVELFRLWILKNHLPAKLSGRYEAGLL